MEQLQPLNQLQVDLQALNIATFEIEDVDELGLLIAASGSSCSTSSTSTCSTCSTTS